MIKLIPHKTKDDRKTPLVLLIYGLQTLLTTAVCIADYASWTLIDTAAKWNLSTLYGPYLILGMFSFSFFLLFFFLS